MIMMMMTVTRLVIQDYYLHHHFTLIFFDVGTYDLLLKLHYQKKVVSHTNQHCNRNTF